VRHALRLEYDSRATRSVDALDARILAHEDGVLHERSRRGEVEAGVALRYANHTRGHVDLPRLEAGKDPLPGPCDDPVGEPLVVRDGADEVDIESGGLTFVVDELEGREAVIDSDHDRLGRARRGQGPEQQDCHQSSLTHAPPLL
jgi:hypothetical protein